MLMFRIWFQLFLTWHNFYNIFWKWLSVLGIFHSCNINNTANNLGNMIDDYIKNTCMFFDGPRMTCQNDKFSGCAWVKKRGSITTAEIFLYFNGILQVWTDLLNNGRVIHYGIKQLLQIANMLIKKKTVFFKMWRTAQKMKFCI